MQDSGSIIEQHYGRVECIFGGSRFVAGNGAECDEHGAIYSHGVV